jgi:magnesium transporter
MARTRCYRNGVLIDEDFPLADVSEHLDELDTLVSRERVNFTY